MGKKQSPVRITFLCKTGQPIPQPGDVAQKNTLFYRTSPSGCFGILWLFYFRIEDGRRAFEEENDFLQRDITENSNNLVQNQKQVTVALHQ